MVIPTKIKKFFGKCKKPFSSLSKLTKKNKKESIVPSSTIPTITTTTTIDDKEEIIATKDIKEIKQVKEIKVNNIIEEDTLPERQHRQFDTKSRQQQQQPQLHSFSTTKNNYKRYSINNIFNKPKFTSPNTPSFIHPVAIKLNVGGINYMTTQQTLCTYPSYLSELFFLFRSPNSPPSSNCSQYPWPEELFIDRDGELFIHILSFLRNGTLPYNIPLSILQKLGYEARFYGVKPLQTLISHRIQIHTSSPKFKVIPIERLGNEDDYFNENVGSTGVGLRRSNLSSSYSISSLPQQRHVDSDNLSLSSSSSGDSSEVVPIIYNPCSTTSASHTPITDYSTPNTRTPKSSTSTTNYATKNNYYLSSTAAKDSDYKPEYEIISITKVPIILNDNSYNYDQIHYLHEEAAHTKEMATFVVLQRKDD